MACSFIALYCLQMSIPSMEEDILGDLTQGNEPQLNIMHATYLLMQCCSEPYAADMANQLFLSLHSEYTSEKSLVIT